MGPLVQGQILPASHGFRGRDYRRAGSSLVFSCHVPGVARCTAVMYGSSHVVIAVVGPNSWLPRIEVHIGIFGLSRSGCPRAAGSRGATLAGSIS